MQKIISKKSVYKAQAFEIFGTEIELSNGNKVNYNFMELGESAMMVPINDQGEVILITEYFQTIDSRMLSLPKGRIENGMDAETTANKELQEEIGFKADKVDKLATFLVAPGYVSLKTHVFLMRNLSESKLEGDEDEEIELVPTSFEKIDELIEKGEIKEARIVAALLLAKNFLKNNPS